MGRCPSALAVRTTGGRGSSGAAARMSSASLASSPAFLGLIYCNRVEKKVSASG